MRAEKGRRSPLCFSALIFGARDCNFRGTAIAHKLSFNNDLTNLSAYLIILHFTSFHFKVGTFWAQDLNYRFNL